MLEEVLIAKKCKIQVHGLHLKRTKYLSEETKEITSEATALRLKVKFSE